MSSKPKVLVVDTLSGGNDFGVALACALAPVVDLTFLTVTDTKVPADLPARVIAAIPGFSQATGKFGKVWQMARFLAVLARELWRHRRGAVHVQFFRFAWLEAPVYWAARPFLDRLVFTAHNVVPHEARWWHAWFYRRWYASVDLVHVMSEQARQGVLEFGVPPARIRFVPHGDYALFQQRHADVDRLRVRQEKGFGADDVVVGFFGLNREYKGLPHLARAFCLLPETSRCVLAIAGGGERAEFDRASAELRQGGRLARVRMSFGFLEDRDLAAWLSCSDIVVLPYRRIYQSGALLLAMTYGKALVLSDIAGFRAYVAEGEAVFVDPEDAAGLAHAIETLAADEALRARLAQACRQRCTRDYAWPVIARQLAALYTESSLPAGVVVGERP